MLLHQLAWLVVAAGVVVEDRGYTSTSTVYAALDLGPRRGTPDTGAQSQRFLPFFSFLRTAPFFDRYRRLQCRKFFDPARSAPKIALFSSSSTAAAPHRFLASELCGWLCR